MGPLLRWLGRYFPDASFQRAASIEVRGGEIHFRRINGEAATLPWDGLTRVSIRTTDQGPFTDDVFFVLESAGTTIEIFQDAPGCDTLLTELQTLPGFDNNAVIEAMGCTDNQTFLCWKRDTGA